MKTDLTRVFKLIPATKVLFSDILPRLNWRGQTGRSAYGIERSRRWLNGAMSGFLSERNMHCIPHRNISLLHLIRDGVHLSHFLPDLQNQPLAELLLEDLADYSDVHLQDLLDLDDL
ncbi:hypothetical protein G5714_002548 [Onychostoma macrolepis]|uniref:Uncharacterized protein n=1 Tax=Onychostoma macrolepis TaxID=369639 RepID=A0A7J6D707_9TELE|nr:hypothetical protein G5714_002548 [Onychostoma macrolepis]